MLAPHAQSITGVDISQGQVDLYNKRAADLGYTPDQMKALCATWEDLDTKLGGAKFDLVVVSLFFISSTRSFSSQCSVLNHTITSRI